MRDNLHPQMKQLEFEPMQHGGSQQCPADRDGKTALDALTATLTSKMVGLLGVRLVSLTSTLHLFLGLFMLNRSSTYMDLHQGIVPHSFILDLSSSRRISCASFWLWAHLWKYQHT